MLFLFKNWNEHHGCWMEHFGLKIGKLSAWKHKHILQINILPRNHNVTHIDQFVVVTLSFKICNQICYISTKNVYDSFMHNTLLKTDSRGGGYSRFFLVGTCHGENENWPIHLPNFDPKLDPYIYQKSKICPDFEKCLQNLC